MPTQVVPIQDQKDLQLSAHFYNTSHSDAMMSANFVNLLVSTDLAMSAYFKALNNNNLNMSATFNVPSNLNMSATFLNPTSIVSLPMRAAFFKNAASTDLTSSAVFFKKQDLPMSATIIVTTRRDFVIYATFVQRNTLPMNATFFAPATNDLRMKAFLGTFAADLAMGATFITTGKTDFKANIVIQSYVSPKAIEFGENNDFLAEITIVNPFSAQNPVPEAQPQNTISESPHILHIEKGQQPEDKE